MPIFNNSLTLFSQKSVEGSFLSAGLGVKSLNYTDRNLIDDYDSLRALYWKTVIWKFFCSIFAFYFESLARLDTPLRYWLREGIFVAVFFSVFRARILFNIEK